MRTLNQRLRASAWLRGLALAAALLLAVMPSLSRVVVAHQAQPEAGWGDICHAASAFGLASPAEAAPAHHGNSGDSASGPACDYCLLIGGPPVPHWGGLGFDRPPGQDAPVIGQAEVSLRPVVNARGLGSQAPPRG